MQYEVASDGTNSIQVKTWAEATREADDRRRMRQKNIVIIDLIDGTTTEWN